MLFCNIGWMDFYKGITDKDQIVGGGAYVYENGMGHEVCNFVDVHGKVYGYVQPPKSGEVINIDRLGGKGQDYVDDTLVIWTAKRPKIGTVVIGWYKHATVYRSYREFDKVPQLHHKNGLGGYWFVADVKNVKLLPIDERVVKIPRGIKGGMGQSNIWFADTPNAKKTVDEVLDLVLGKRHKNKSRIGKKTDAEHNARVEQAGISVVKQYYEKLGYEVKSVEKDNVGWDLEVHLQRVKLVVEVKGLSGNVKKIQLTANEYSAFESKFQDYRLAIVSEALTSPKLVICRYSRENSEWLVEGRDFRVRVEEVKSANVEIID